MICQSPLNAARTFQALAAAVRSEHRKGYGVARKIRLTRKESADEDAARCFTLEDDACCAMCCGGIRSDRLQAPMTNLLRPACIRRPIQRSRWHMLWAS